jgi:two-component system phosphate regulon response regulator PhoB
VVAGHAVPARSAHRVPAAGTESPLTATEYHLLDTLVERRGRVQSRERLLQDVWQHQPDMQTRTVDMHIQRLRTKLGNHASLIETVRGFGYRFRGPEKAARRQ